MKTERTVLIERKERLEAARTQLKEDFIGIDPIIDEVVNTISAWYLVPELQEKPLVINLWGLTGVGKTSLVERLVELTDLVNRHYRLDMGDGDSFWQIREQLREIHEYSNGKPIVLTLDEFQHLRTINEEKKEIRSSSSRFIWQLIDSGKVPINDLNARLIELEDLLSKTIFFIRNGVVIKDGLVVKRRNYFMNETGRSNSYEFGHWKKKKNFKIHLIRERYHELLYHLDRRNFDSIYDVERFLCKMDGPETVAYLQRLYEKEIIPKVLDCSKALIFVIGNIDEAYTVSHNLDPDISADEFHELCKHINVPKIKKSLKQRFRNEEIARMGNNHLIYPAFNSDTYRKIIQQEVDRWKVRFSNSHGISVDIDTSVLDLIYEEGVYPTQGTRPVFTTIHQVIQSRAGAMLSHCYLNAVEADRIRLSYNDSEVMAEFFKDESKTGELNFPQTLKLGSLRECQHDDHQAISAVHESGHAICSTMLMRLVPETVVSSTANPDAEGFTFTRSKAKFIAKREIVQRLAIYLGGYAAEIVVFGEDNVTTGAESDIKHATEFITSLLKRSGMGGLPALYAVPSLETNLRFYDTGDRINSEIERYIKTGLDMAMETLQQEEGLLLAMSDYLSDHRLMDREQIIETCEQYGTEFDRAGLVEDETRRFYRDFLKNKVSGISEKASVSDSPADYALLNKQTGQ